MNKIQEIDNVQFGWSHIKSCMICGIGFFTDAYDLFVISIAVQMIGYVYYQDNNNQVPSNVDGAIKVSALIGTLIGQLLFGYLADKYGRKKIYGVELLIIIFTTFCSCLSADMVKGLTMVQMLIFWRFFLGIGIGGDYPVSAVIMSESSKTSRRGALIATIFAMQGLGIMMGSLVSCLVIFLYQDLINQNQDNIDYVWRTVVGLGIVPAVATLYFRLTMKETVRFKANQIDLETLSQAKVHSLLIQDLAVEIPSKKKLTFIDFYSVRRNLLILLGTSVSWFALDVAFYGINLNNPIILDAIGYNDKSTPYNTLLSSSLGNFYISLLGTVPGYWFTVFLVDTMGRKTIQVMGFIILTVVFFVIGIFYNQLGTLMLIILITVANFFNNFGPNATTFIIPGEVFPTSVRSTSHGISAASGKLGAIISQFGFSQLKDYGGQPKEGAFIPYLFIIFGVFMFIGLIATIPIPETKNRSLEEIADDYVEIKQPK